MVNAISVIATAMEGAIVALALQAFLDIAKSWEKISRKKVVILKLIFTLASAGGAIANAMFEMPLYEMCTSTSRAENILFHISMITADWIMLSRATIVLVSHPKLGTITERLLVVVRICCGLFDVFKSYATYSQEDGTCIYIEYPYAGILYSVIDLFIDIYVTIAITIYLNNHSAKLNGRLGGFYGTIVGSNLLRTFVLVIFNTATLVIDLQTYQSWQQLVWQATDIAYILTVAYDADMVKMVAKLQPSITSQKISSGRPNVKGAITITTQVHDPSSIQLETTGASGIPLSQPNEFTLVHLNDDTRKLIVTSPQTLP